MQPWKRTLNLFIKGESTLGFLDQCAPSLAVWWALRRAVWQSGRTPYLVRIHRVPVDSGLRRLPVVFVNRFLRIKATETINPRLKLRTMADQWQNIRDRAEKAYQLYLRSTGTKKAEALNLYLRLLNVYRSGQPDSRPLQDYLNNTAMPDL